MRIITRLAGGGPPIHATLLNRNLQSHGFDSVLVFGECSSEEKNMEYLLNPNDPLERVPFLSAKPSPIRDLRALFALWKLMRKYRPDVVHTHTAKAGFLGRLAALFAGVRCIVHTYHGHVLEGYFHPAVNAILKWVERGMGLASTALVTVSAQQAHELSQEFAIAPANKMHVVPLGLDLKPFLALPMPTGNPPMTIGWLGRFVPIKNIPLLIDVLATTEARGLPIRFLIAGEGPERAWLEQKIESLRLKQVQLLPWVDRVETFIEQCDLLMLTSHREGTPLALIQGMAAGRPFVSTAAGGTVDLAHGVSELRSRSWWFDNAVLVEPSADAFVAAFEQLLEADSRYLRMCRSAREFATSAYGQERLVSDISSLYRGLIGPLASHENAGRAVHP
jgi:glycosyltransferase involved in cell wall biosynthesis